MSVSRFLTCQIIGLFWFSCIANSAYCGLIYQFEQSGTGHVIATFEAPVLPISYVDNGGPPHSFGGFSIHITDFANEFFGLGLVANDRNVTGHIRHWGALEGTITDDGMGGLGNDPLFPDPLYASYAYVGVGWELPSTRDVFLVDYNFYFRNPSGADFLSIHAQKNQSVIVQIMGDWRATPVAVPEPNSITRWGIFAVLLYVFSYRIQSRLRDFFAHKKVHTTC